MSVQLRSADLDEFVRRSDELGGPSAPRCDDYWRGLTYVPSCVVDCELDPFDERYVSQQIRLYEEMSGRQYHAVRDEMTSLDVPSHVLAPNPYNHPDPAALAVHIQRLARAFSLASPALGEKLLDMGCGWGLSSEVAAYVGLQVHAVDINPEFVRLVRERAQRGSRNIQAEQSTFESYVPREPADLAMFYECLHHAVRPWSVIDRMFESLKNGGRLILAGEPINDYWWPNWGMRLDPISIYCIRKFGWFESGWSLSFILQVLHRSGFVPEVHNYPDSAIGYTILGRKNESHEVPGNVAAMLFHSENTLVDGSWLLLTGRGKLCLTFPRNVRRAILNFSCFRGADVRAKFEFGDTVVSKVFSNGASEVSLSANQAVQELRFDVESWSPAEELGSPDARLLGLHLKSVVFPKD